MSRHTLPSAHSSPRLCVVLAVIAGASLSLSVAQAGRVTYTKNLLVTDVNLGAANLWIGGETQTWSRKPAQDAVKVLFDSPTFGNVAITRSYRHYTDQTDADALLAGNQQWGLPARLWGPLSTSVAASCLSEDGYGSRAHAEIVTAPGPLPGDEPTIPVRERRGNDVVVVQKPIDWTRASNLVLSGYAEIPTNEQYEPSADSFAAAAVSGGKVFRWTSANPAESGWELTGKVRFIGSAEARQTVSEAHDPWVIRFTDLETEQWWIEEIMRLDWSSLDADLSIDDTGIAMTLDTANTEAKVDFSFTMPSSWVINPYEYGASMTPEGLTAWGATPASGWQVSTTGTVVTAFFPFGAEGQPWDSAMVRPPSSLLIPGHDYSYDAGAGAGVFILGGVPGPSTLTVLAGVVALSAMKPRSRGEAAVPR